MAPSRAYVPSRALLRALWRPLPPRCPFARPLPSQFLRGKRTRAAKPEKDALKSNISRSLGLKLPSTVEEAEKIISPIPDDKLDDPNIPVVSWYEQDLDNASSERFISRIATVEDRRKHNELSRMLEEDANNPNYDDAVLNRRLLDDLMTNPNFGDLTEELQALKADIMTKEESRAMEEKIRKEQEHELKELDASLRMTTHESIQDLINDPELADARGELLDLQDKMPEADDLENPEFQAALQRVETKLAGNEAFRRKLAALEEQEDAHFDEDSHIENEIDQLKENDPIDTPEDLDKLLVQMKDLMHSMGGDKQLEAELDAVIKEDPFAESEGDLEKEMDFEELSEELAKLAKSPTAAQAIDEPDEKLDPELEAKVDQIMQDPKLMEKLMYIRNFVAEEQRKAAELTNIQHQTAPDPLTVEPSKLTSIQQRLQMAQSDPEHIAALRRLRVNLLPPFNISPALKSFNQAIELSYLGANDDIRRILWRAYSKARTLPTFLQNLSEDAWDLLYYSQAVTWGSNQNRQNHLRLLLQDLRSVGRDGPPTHPSTLARDKDEEYNEA
ncbi:hypothetical protein BU26DRAFT_129860 [Trematosphaeria pertusa]|uniref:Uncharacterized protein n=1 Tax=Trematosphaeria pertusa TaxID=390896 RepID=A0A6A6HX85_9PLEO|nr:uncharacterized protein BU26DRAFT_129860 [Trematosphaeria pertusa]KAF2242647.1 hypothetical protein BU26DRAFT_129860 [Trematosphaeria pertusa]